MAEFKVLFTYVDAKAYGHVIESLGLQPGLFPAIGINTKVGLGDQHS